MRDGSNSINCHRVGVIRENPIRCVCTADDQGNIFAVSSSEFESRADLKEGDCCVVDFETNFNEELGSGVYNAKIYRYGPVTVWPLHETLTDVTVVSDKERLATLDFKRSIYLEERFLLRTQHVDRQIDQKDIFNLSYNLDQEVGGDSTGQRVYSLYLRVAQKGDIGDSTKRVNTTAFTVDEFLDQAEATESSGGQNVINFKISYAEYYSADTTACTWGATGVFTLRFTN